MVQFEKIKSILLNKYGNTEHYENLIGLYNLIKRYGLNPVREIYPHQLFDENIEILIDAHVLEESYQKNSQEKPLLNGEINRFNTLNIDWVRYFVIFGEIGNTADAAKHLNISTQALLKAISGIEAHYNIKLVEREKHFKGLTLTGQLFLEKSRILLQNLNDLDRYFSNIKYPLSGTIKIGFSNLWSDQLLPEFIGNFVQKFPETNPKLYSMPGTEIIKWLGAGELEIGLLGENPKNPDLVYMELGKNPYLIVGKPQEKVNFRDLSYIVPGSLNLSNDIFLSLWFKENFFDCKVILEINNLQMALNMAESGLGACWVPEMAVRDRLERGSLAIIAEPPTEYYALPIIVWSKKLQMSQLLTEFIKELRKTFKNMI